MADEADIANDEVQKQLDATMRAVNVKVPKKKNTALYGWMN